ncbi:thiamine diphosphokinase [Carboxydothermus hydrogenoformans]|uniref:Thiamine diphosphokinase n=1 Tax=Carboxydothermus hydrogenoformans (strain ATCC BAA-161 / DSM 6008 / Z-2901) TaxID=246194 RepID=Q3AFI1_CARHZ|nr:thiamine diphosphokinase [Carboxydothermus hydrogenoformans]ABB15049.1 thiamine pyrophosphokinase [Carboxydothermus hydrogenoformans Z-2901]
MRVIIFAGGEAPGFLPDLTPEDYLIVADGGARHLPPEVIPDLLLGDMDSLPKNLQEEFKRKGVKLKIYPAEKDFTDLEAAVQTAQDLDASEVVVVGGTGGRSDHFFANLLLLAKCSCPVTWIGHDFTGYLNKNPLILKGKPGQLFSVIPLTGEVTGLTIEGAKYPLVGANLSWGTTLGLSNEFIADTVRISWVTGKLILLQIF